jgi:glutaredoxin
LGLDLLILSPKEIKMKEIKEIKEIKEVKVFSSSSCSSCKLLIKELNKLNIQYSYIDIEENPAEALRNKIMRLPTVIIIHQDNKYRYEGMSRELLQTLHH